VQSPLQKEPSVYLVYGDDSSENGVFQVMAALIVPDHRFVVLERILGVIIEAQVPEDLRPSFEFHAADLLAGNKPFDKLDREQRMGLLSNCATVIAGNSTMPTSIIYGAVDIRKLRGGQYASAQPMDIAFRRCIPEVERWFLENADHDFGILILDDTNNPGQKKTLQATFRANRTRNKLLSSSYKEGIKEDRGKWAHIHDDMYFGDSSYSVGLQMADICALIILRHLQGKEDTELLYKKIEKQIYSGKVEPNEES